MFFFYISFIFNNPVLRRKIYVVALINSILCAGALAVLGAPRLINYVLSVRTNAWVAVPGVISESKLTFHPARNQPIQTADITYDYVVEGINYQGHIVQYGLDDNATFFPLSKIVAAYPKGKLVRVFYNSKDPGDSVLIRGFPSKGISIMLIIFFYSGLSFIFSVFIKPPKN